ncbi:MAG: type II/IV secretion system ATPase subunit [Dehalococcoidia bacterium]|nr:type II/IV secretion system ATPase subunit [Dehalococcoidia bacterium]MCB9484711.1 type II/IV secretion system ATPase subunit [Thermoflexaceae bacterium]
MPPPRLPWSPEIRQDGAELAEALPYELQEACQDAQHLWQYLQMFPMEEIGVPDFVPKLQRGSKSRNIIYPVGDGVFIHIFDDPMDARNWYMAIEPMLLADLDGVLGELDHILLDYVEDLVDTEDKDVRRESLIKLLTKVCQVENGPITAKVRRTGKKVRVSREEFEALKYLIVRDKVGMGALQPLILDPNVEDISCSGVGSLFVEHKMFKSLKASITFDHTDDLDDFVLRLSERMKKPVTFRRPIVDSTLPDGSRINIVFGKDVSTRGSNFTIRKFAGIPISIIELVGFGSISPMMAAYLWMVIGDGMNLFVSGETASGKTTLLNALTAFIEPAGKVVTLEDTSELQVPHPNWTRELTRDGSAGEGTGVGMFDLLKAALRQRPDAIMVGEIRGEEGAIAFQAMQTGHQVMSTFHAATVEKLIQRITGHPISVPKTYMDNLNVVALQSAVRLGNGQTVRRVMGINEIISYDPVGDTFSYLEIFHWNPVTDEFEFPGNKNSYLLESRVAPKMGIPPHRVFEVYDELQRRAEIIEQLQREGVNNFYDVYSHFSRNEH